MLESAHQSGTPSLCIPIKEEKHEKCSKLYCCIVVACSTRVCGGGTVKFTSAEPVDPVVFAKDNLNINAKKLGIKKLVILECYGEYVTSKEITNSANDQRYTGWIRTNTDTLEFGKDYYTVTSNIGV
jgi:hypothetical protein